MFEIYLCCGGGETFRCARLYAALGFDGRSSSLSARRNGASPLVIMQDFVQDFRKRKKRNHNQILNGHKSKQGAAPGGLLQVRSVEGLAHDGAGRQCYRRAYDEKLRIVVACLRFGLRREEDESKRSKERQRPKQNDSGKVHVLQAAKGGSWCWGFLRLLRRAKRGEPNELSGLVQ